MEYIFPLSEYLTITQGFSKTKPHLGLDFGWTSAHKGQGIIAAEEGTVYQRADGYGNTYPNKKIYGNYVILKHPNGDYTVYAHLAKGLLVKKGDKVQKGQILGYMGSSGFSTGQHLHFELRKGGYNKSKYAIDPLPYLAIENTNLIVSEKTLYPDKIKYRKTTWGNPVPRDNTVDQVEVIATQLRARKDPGLKGEILGIVDTGIYNVLHTQEMDGYTWYHVEDFWFADNGSWCKFLPKAEPKYDIIMYELNTAQRNAMEVWAKAEGIRFESKKV